MTKKAPATNAQNLPLSSLERQAQIASAISWFALGVILILLAVLAYDYMVHGYGLHPLAAQGVAGLATILCVVVNAPTSAEAQVIEGQDLPVALPLNRKV